MYLFGIPVLFIGLGLLVKLYMDRNPDRSRVRFTPKKLPAYAMKGYAITCPDCRSTLDHELDSVRSDGSVVCSKCGRSFIPQQGY